MSLPGETSPSPVVVPPPTVHKWANGVASTLGKGVMFPWWTSMGAGPRRTVRMHGRLRPVGRRDGGEAAGGVPRPDGAGHPGVQERRLPEWPGSRGTAPAPHPEGFAEPQGPSALRFEQRNAATEA